MEVGAALDVEDTNIVVEVGDVETAEDEDEDEEEAVVMVVNLEVVAEIGIALVAVAGPIGKGVLTEADEAEETEAIGARARQICMDWDFRRCEIILKRQMNRCRYCDRAMCQKNVGGTSNEIATQRKVNIED